MGSLLGWLATSFAVLGLGEHLRPHRRNWRPGLPALKRDGSVLAQLGTPDMRVPIAFGLAWPDRVASGAQALDFQTLADMSFESMDSRGHRERFPGLRLAWDTLAAPSGTTAVLNAAKKRALAASGAPAPFSVEASLICEGEDYKVI